MPDEQVLDATDLDVMQCVVRRRFANALHLQIASVAAVHRER
jgi:hypothetical protein